MDTEDEGVDAYMPLWIGDYLRDTQHLSYDLHGPYLLILMAYWTTGRPFADDDSMAAITRMGTKWKKAKPVLMRFFTVADGRLHHKRVEKELKDAREHKAKAVERAKKAAEGRYGPRNKDATSNAQAPPQAVLGECPSPSPSTNLVLIPPVGPPSVLEDPYPGGFIEFWLDYPKKAMQAEAEAEWIKLGNGDGPGIELRREIKAGLERWKRSEQWKKGMVAHPARWLRNGEWMSEINDIDTKEKQRGNNSGGKPQAPVAQLYDPEEMVVVKLPNGSETLKRRADIPAVA